MLLRNEHQDFDNSPPAKSLGEREQKQDGQPVSPTLASHPSGKLQTAVMTPERARVPWVGRPPLRGFFKATERALGVHGNHFRQLEMGKGTASQMAVVLESSRIQE